MTPKERAAMQQALEALEELHYSSGTVVAAKKYESATAALREALAEQEEQEPVADKVLRLLEPFMPQDAAPVRTKDLTDDEMEELCRKYARFELIREAIAADRSKNK